MANEMHGELRPMETAPRDGTDILAQVRHDSSRWPGRWFIVSHEGVVDCYDLGWRLFPGFGGVSDQSFAGWLPMPARAHLKSNGGE
jgi:hypothetical protein